MVVKLVSDVHGAIDALLNSVESSDILVILGDLLDIMDFETLDGLLTQVYTRKRVGSALESWVKGDQSFMQDLIRGALSPDGREFEQCCQAARGIYARLSELPCETYILPGNVDFPDLLGEIKCGNINQVGLGETIEIDRQKFGFVGSALPSPMALPGEVPQETFDSRVSRLEAVDVLCSHIPPALKELTYDTKGRRHEKGSQQLLNYVTNNRPWCSYFGHVHNPEQQLLAKAGTMFCNTGFFKHTRQPFSHSGGRSTNISAGD